MLSPRRTSPWGQAMSNYLTVTLGAADRKGLVVVDEEGQALGLLDRQRALSAPLPPWPDAPQGQ